MRGLVREIEKALRDGQAGGAIGGNERLILSAARDAAKAGFPRKHGRLAETLSTFLTRCEAWGDGEMPTGERLYAFLREREFNYAELCALPACLRFLALKRVLGVCAGRVAGEKAEFAVGVLRFARSPDCAPDRLFAAGWKPEEALASADSAFLNSTPETRAAVRKAVAYRAKRAHADELLWVETLIERAKTEGKTLYDLLFSRQNGGIAAVSLWSAAFFGGTGLAVAWAISLFGWVAALLVLPIVQAVLPLCDRLASRFDRTPPAPRLALKSIPKEGKTVVAVTVLLAPGEDDPTERLERFFLSSPGENVYFGLVADLPEASAPVVRGDRELLARVQARIDALNARYGERFFLFRRDREPMEDGKWGGKERKRGAIAALLSRLRGGGAGNLHGCLPTDAEFLLTLDADTGFAPGFLQNIVGVALHPANRRFGVFQPAVQTGLAASYRTFFTRLMAGNGGGADYERAVFDRSMLLFGEGIYCGKALLRIDRFARLATSFPEGKILSHDVLEGGRAGTLALPDLSLYDGIPVNAVSWNRRAHRWMRGDVQNLAFLSDPGLSVAVRVRIVSGVLAHLTPVAALASILAGAVFLRSEETAARLVLFAVSYLLLPFCAGVLSDLWAGGILVFRHALTKALSAFALQSLRLCNDLVSLCRSAYLALDAAVRAGWRMLVSHKKLLEWTTAAQAEADSAKPSGYIADGVLSFLTGTALFLAGGASAYRLAGLAFFLYPPVAWFLSRPLEKKEPPALQAKDRALLLRHAGAIWSFFAENVNAASHHLPPDNRQYAPKAFTDLRTSPTNIGLYLLSVLAAMDLGLCDVREGASRLEKTLAAVMGLQTVRGNLYNWYDLQTCRPLGHFVSFVDSGNLAVSLLTLSEGLKEYAGEDERALPLAKQARALADRTDLALFYDEEKRLFSLGVDALTGKREAGCYDFLMSEARTGSFYAVAAGLVPASHWNALSREVVSHRGYIGMSSWSGTAFEYLMPRLFLPCEPNSFLKETLLFALSAQTRAAHKGLWGISESGYYGFDADLHYRYRAHGVRALALRDDPGEETVFAPYAVYLFLSVSPAPCCRGLREWEKRTPFGPHGLYEAVDFTPARDPSGEGAVVKSYMAHHLGMSLLAITNALRDDLFVGRFFADKRMASASVLLQEKIPARPVGSALPLRRVRLEKPGGVPEKTAVKSDLSHPKAGLLVRDNLTLLAGSPGHLALLYDGKDVFDCRFDRFSALHAPCVLFTDEKGLAHGCTALTGEGEASMEQTREHISFVCAGKRFAGAVRCSFAKYAAALKIEVNAESGRKYGVSLSFRPVLQDRRDYDAHRSFSRLFLQSEYDETERVLYLCRRARENGRPCLWLAVALAEETREFAFCTDERALPPERVSPVTEVPAASALPGTPSTEPFVLLSVPPVPGGKTAFLFAPAETKEQARNAIRTARKSGANTCSVLPEKASELLTAVLYPVFRAPSDPLALRRDLLWKLGIPGDFPLLGFRFGEKTRELMPVLSAWEALRRAGVRTELVLFPEGDGQYFRPAEKKLYAVCDALGLSPGKAPSGGGLFPVRSEQMFDDVKNALSAVCRLPADARSDGKTPLFGFVPPVRRVTDPLPFPNAPEHAIATALGYADENGFLLDRTREAVSPVCYLLPGRTAGSVITASSLGYTFAGNAHERRITPATDDYGTLPDGEVLYLREQNTLYDLAACASAVYFSHGTARWSGRAAGVSYTMTCFVDPVLPCKFYLVGTDKPCELILAVRPAMGDFAVPNPAVTQFLSDGALCFHAGMTPAFDRGVGFLYADGGEPIVGQSELFSGKRDAFSDLFAVRVIGKTACFTLGGCEETALHDVLHAVKTQKAGKAEARAKEFARSFLPPLRIETKSPSLDRFLTLFLPYQVAASRVYCRASFRQSGGAYGFRDQLQDGLALVFSDPAAVRAHLLRCLARQYEEGDVMHWWHENGVGVRTTCSDDLLWLPLAVADYIEKTGDTAFLDETVPYLSSPPLQNENERCETPTVSSLREPVLPHLLRAFAHADRRGKHGLILMGCCDWNDGFSAVGKAGKGESVFSTFLYVVAVRKALPILRTRFPEEADALERTAAELLANAETHAWAGDRWLRAFHDDGEKLGAPGRSECAIDILTQAFALFAGADGERCKKALDTAEKSLYDPAHKLLLLFAPPFSDGETDVGYVRGYPPGVRENGGQYTHAAVWGAIAFLRVGKTDTALDLLCGMNPFSRVSTREELRRYRSEPFVLCADIASGALAGMGGWSWYTGSAAWLYKAFREEVFGFYTFDSGRVVDFRPRVPCTLTFSPAPGTVLTLRAVVKEDDDGSGSPRRATLDGERISLPCAVPKGKHCIEVGV